MNRVGVLDLSVVVSSGTGSGTVTISTNNFGYEVISTCVDAATDSHSWTFVVKDNTGFVAYVPDDATPFTGDVTVLQPYGISGVSTFTITGTDGTYAVRLYVRI